MNPVAQRFNVWSKAVIYSHYWGELNKCFSCSADDLKKYVFCLVCIFFSFPLSGERLLHSSGGVQGGQGGLTHSAQLPDVQDVVLSFWWNAGEERSLMWTRRLWSSVYLQNIKSCSSAGFSPIKGQAVIRTRLVHTQRWKVRRQNRCVSEVRLEEED